MTFNNEILDVIKKSNNVAICCHIRPDADCLGSASALKSTLLKLNKNADIFCDSEISDNYLFLPHIDKINPHVGVYDTYIAVDCADAPRTGKYAEMFRNNENTLSIDHHLFNSAEFTKYTVKEDVSSTAEILYYLIKELGVEIEEEIAVGLYAGMSSDTGGFMHSNTTAQLHTIVGQIMDLIPNVTDINYYLFKKRTLGQVDLLKTALNNLTYICNKKVAITYLTDKDFKKTNTINSETFGIVDMCTNIEDIEIGILISEKSHNLYSCSLRGRNRNVALIAEVFGGGGHKLAAGCNIFGSYKTVIEKLEKAINDNYDRVCEC